MPQPPRDLLVRAGDELRGTQSFVQVMAAVFRRPTLTLMEIAWRWAVGILVIAIVAKGKTDIYSHGFDALYWRDLGTALLHGALIFRLSAVGLCMLAAAIVGWAAVSGLGRSAVLRRLDPALHPRRGTVVVLSILRVVAFSILIAGWLWAVMSIWLWVIAGSEPSYVAGFAAAVVLTLVLFMLWSIVSWVFPLAVTLSMLRDLNVTASWRAACASGELRGKLIEINLVMGIVKIALVVLAMVFSATPLPFESYTTDSFMSSWWIGVALFYMLASDFFHVVRAAAYLAFCRAYEIT